MRQITTIRDVFFWLGNIAGRVVSPVYGLNDGERVIVPDEANFAVIAQVMLKQGIASTAEIDDFPWVTNLLSAELAKSRVCFVAKID